MGSETLHAPRERLKRTTLTRHHAIISLMEELEAADWYQQRADDCEDEALREILLHNMREEIEHASMVLEWLRRNDEQWDETLRTYLFTSAPIPEVEDIAEHGGEPESAEEKPEVGTVGPERRMTIGELKGK